MAQRRVRTLCHHCKQPDSIEESVWREFCQDDDLDMGAPHKPVGCLECRQTGYLGRIGLYEMLEITDTLVPLITADSDLQEIRRQAKTDGLLSLRHSGAKKVAQGLTTLEEVMRVTPFSSQ